MVKNICLSLENLKLGSTLWQPPKKLLNLIIQEHNCKLLFQQLLLKAGRTKLPHIFYTFSSTSHTPFNSDNIVSMLSIPIIFVDNLRSMMSISMLINITSSWSPVNYIKQVTPPLSKSSSLCIEYPFISSTYFDI